ncbi:MAG TPA: CusA/CzcA family heavy metal efflux RND transporter [bacterium]|nr:CusA/CzcA family heavy metal efflux RND transporter [bacterium]HQG44720.1 CusA/CzcA family heavy metal efflux RND transporter [bacterium]HQI48510.1 CusA/CzcA family heavy metal efflux RND transporter [bacterium]HQJ63067.1 CusA/CzcA family heavy metal efflux RND transporter [bacterium]
MLERIITLALQRRGMAILLALLITGFGLYAAITLPIDAFPDVTNNQVEVVSHADGLSAVEIERSVTFPVEMAMRGIPKVKELRSVTKFGLSIVTIIFEDDVDIYFARQLVFERLTEAREAVPPGVEISMGPIATVMGEIYQFTLEGPIPQEPAAQKAYLTELRTLEEWVINPLLKSVPGVNEINSYGGYFKQYQVIVQPELLVKYGLTIADVFAAIENNNQNAGGSIIEKYATQYIVRSVGLIGTTADIGDIVLKARMGTPIYLREVAEVRIGVATRQGAALINGGQETVGGIVMMLRGENSREVVRRVKAKVAEINSGGILPKGIRIVPYYDRSDIVTASVGTVTRALVEGAVLVMVILFLLLRSLRGSLVVLLALPLSLLLTFIAMKYIGLDANLMSLGGLAISIGMIIDATIIQVENVQRHLSRPGVDTQSRFAVVLQSVLEVRKPSIFGELIITITFVPILALEGIEGKMFTPLALTVVIALLASLLLSIFVIPVLCGLLLRVRPEKESPVMAQANRFYRRLLAWSTSKPRLVAGTAVALLTASLLLIPLLGTEFIPIMDEGAFDMDVALLPGVSLDKAIEVNRMVGEKLKAFPELGTVVGRIGQTGVALDARGVDKTGYVGILKPKREWPRDVSREELTAEMRAAIETIPGIAFGFSQPIQCRIDEIVAGTRAQLIIKLFGEDLELLKSKADEIARAVASLQGTTDLQVEKISGQPYLTIAIDRARIARYGINISEVQDVIETAIAGKSASTLYEESRSFDIVVRLPEGRRDTPDLIGNILVRSPEGADIPLAQLAEITLTEGPAQISRENGLRRIGIEMNVTGRDMGGFVDEAARVIKKKVALPPGYYLQWGGQFANQRRAMNRLLLIWPLATGAIFLLLFISLRSFRLVLLIMAILPFALIGGVVALFLSGQYLSVPASIGFIVLFGVAVLNGLVLVSHIDQLYGEGMALAEAIRQGARDRLRPVLMTASIAIFSLIPMLFATGTGSEIQKPLAIVVVGGLITSTLLTLIVLPAVYPWFAEKRPSSTH